MANLKLLSFPTKELSSWSCFLILSEIYLTTSEICLGCRSLAVINRGGLLCPDESKDSLPVSEVSKSDGLGFGTV